MTLYQDCSSRHDLSKNMAARGGAYIPPYIYIENFNDLLVRNHWTDLNITLQECVLCNTLSRLFKPSWLVKKHGSQWVGLIFPIYLYRKLVRSHWTDFNITLAKILPLVTDYQDFSSNQDSSKNMAASGWGLFSLYIYLENFNNLLVRNHWTDFNITWQECFFGDPLPRLFKLSWFVKKTWPLG